MHNHINAICRKTKQPMGLNHFKSLVHQRRGINGDLPTHGPRRVGQSLLNCCCIDVRSFHVRNGPPEAVITSLATSSIALELRRHCDMALCSESTGSSSTPCFCTKGSTNAPPATRVSLFAKAISHPRVIPSRTASSPAEPTTAATRMSPGRAMSATSCRAAWGPVRTVTEGPNALAASGSRNASSVTPRSHACLASSDPFPPAARPAISNAYPAPRRCSTTSSVLVPIEPVEPRIITRRASVTPAHPSEPHQLHP